MKRIGMISLYVSLLIFLSIRENGLLQGQVRNRIER